MLKFLTHKLRTHSLNEDSVSEKVEEHDSGTESDDEAERPESDFCTDVIMKWNEVTDISMNGADAVAGAGACEAAGACPPPDPDPLYDHHSSEEELEVINASPPLCARRRAASSPPPPGAGAAPEKRRWPPRGTHTDDDDDDTKVETPVRFRTVPPREALKPLRAAPASAPLSSAPLASAPCPVSPRRRRAPPPAPRRHRPALDFDKMQQLRVVSGARSWRAAGAGGGGAGGELSVFCW